MHRNALIRIAAAGPLLLLAACGGGGDDPEPQPNRNPVLTTTTVAATEDTTFTGQLTATDADNNTLTFTRIADVQHGTLTVNATGAITYAPAANYSGADSFSVRVTDGAGGETIGTVNITVAAVNDAPVLVSTQFTTSEDMPLVATLAATDADGDALTYTVNAGVAHGALTITNPAAFTYTPLPDYHGADGFSVTVSDGAGGQVAGNIAITVTGVNDVPILTSTLLNVDEDSALLVMLTAFDIDGDILTFSLDTGASHGAASISGGGQLSYTPSPNFHGGDVIIARVSDGVSAVNTQVDITVNSVNVPPVANDDEYRIATGAPRTFAVVDNDTESEGETLTVSIVTQPSGGTVTVGANNLLTFTPENAFTGPIEFQYRLTDARGGIDDAQVRAVIGDFPGIVYLSDELSPGKPEILLFDGLDVALVATPPANFEIARFAISGDGTKLAYMVSGPGQDLVFFKPLASTGPGTQIFNNVLPGTPVGSQSVTLNHSGSYALIGNRYLTPGPKRHWVVNTANGVGDLLAGDEAGVVQTSQVTFNPGNDTQILVQGQVGGTTPPDGVSEYFTLFSANAASPRTMVQLGANNAPGTGSGYSVFVGGNGRYVYHGEVTGGPPPTTPFKQSLLVWDNLSQTESVMYRRPMGTERGTGGISSLSNDGGRVCFAFGEVNSLYYIGPAAFHVGSGASPATAGAVSPQYPAVSRCWFSSDDNTLAMWSRTETGGRNELYSMNLTTLAAPARLSHALAPAEEITHTFVARRESRILVGYRIGASTAVRMYAVSPSGGAERLFASNFPNANPTYDNINADGSMLAYVTLSGSTYRLRLMSTQTLDYSVPITPANTVLQRGVGQFYWLPSN
jgi:VCBS repeat-containing protein